MLPDGGLHFQETVLTFLVQPAVSVEWFPRIGSKSWRVQPALKPLPDFLDDKRNFSYDERSYDDRKRRGKGDGEHVEYYSVPIEVPENVRLGKLILSFGEIEFKTTIFRSGQADITPYEPAVVREELAVPSLATTGASDREYIPRGRKVGTERDGIEDVIEVTAVPEFGSIEHQTQQPPPAVETRKGPAQQQPADSATREARSQRKPPKLRRYRSKPKRAILRQLWTNPKLTNIEICQGLDLDGEAPPEGYKDDPEQSFYQKAYKGTDEDLKKYIQNSIDEVQADLRLIGWL
jgi:hypothetical protein